MATKRANQMSHVLRAGAAVAGWWLARFPIAAASLSSIKALIAREVERRRGKVGTGVGWKVIVPRGHGLKLNRSIKQGLIAYKICVEQTPLTRGYCIP